MSGELPNRVEAILEAKRLLSDMDKRAQALPLYVGLNDDPLDALLKIRSFLWDLFAGARPVDALVIVCCDRVIGRLRGGERG
jgi:hypothetical protein